ncbi:MAG: hypothetical protein AB7K04_06780 [Pseudorhodoplanes sp.]
MALDTNQIHTLFKYIRAALCLWFLTLVVWIFYLTGAFTHKDATTKALGEPSKISKKANPDVLLY